MVCFQGMLDGPDRVPLERPLIGAIKDPWEAAAMAPAEGGCYTPNSGETPGFSVMPLNAGAYGRVMLMWPSRTQPRLLSSVRIATRIPNGGLPSHPQRAATADYPSRSYGRRGLNPGIKSGGRNTADMHSTTRSTVVTTAGRRRRR